MIIYHLTWLHYWLTVAIVLLIYYVLLLLTGFRREINDYLNGRLYKRTGTETEDNFEENEEELMGQAADEYGVSTVDSENIHFAPKTVAAHSIYPFPDDGALNGLIPDVLEEFKTIIHTIETEQGTKEDFIGLFKLVSPKYPKIQQSRHIAAINRWIKENVPFVLTNEELANLWRKSN